MINPKNIAFAAFVGFVFSFLVGIFSGIGFGHVMLRALLSALVFAVLGAGISFLFRQFLSDTSDSAFDGAGQNAGDGEHGSGGLVNITIDDDTLADDAAEPQFAVENARAMQPEKPVRPVVVEAAPVADVAEVRDQSASVSPAAAVSPAEAVPESAEAEEVPQFKPVPLAGESFSSPVVSPAPAAEKPVLDELPDLGGTFSAAAKGSGDGTIRDSDFATGNEEPPVNLGASSRSSAPAPESQNAAVMAQAIQTLLAKDN